MFCELGVDIHRRVVRMLMFSQLVLEASALMVFIGSGNIDKAVATDLANAPPAEIWTYYQYCSWLFTLLHWPFCLCFFLPVFANKFCVVSSIERYKDHEVIQRVTRKVRQDRIHSGVMISRAVKSRGKQARLGGHTLSKDLFEDYLNIYDAFAPAKRHEFETAFKAFDTINPHNGANATSHSTDADSGTKGRIVSHGECKDGILVFADM